MANLRLGNRELMKCINRNLVVKSQGPISRMKTARLSGLSLATASGSPLSSSKEKLPKTNSLDQEERRFSERRHRQQD